MIYGGFGFPFRLSVNFPVAKGVVLAVILTPIAIILAGIFALIWCLV
jgi:hypothetical protein